MLQAFGCVVPVHVPAKPSCISQGPSYKGVFQCKVLPVQLCEAKKTACELQQASSKNHIQRMGSNFGRLQAPFAILQCPFDTALRQTSGMIEPALQPGPTPANRKRAQAFISIILILSYMWCPAGILLNVQAEAPGSETRQMQSRFWPAAYPAPWTRAPDVR